MRSVYVGGDFNISFLGCIGIDACHAFSDVSSRLCASHASAFLSLFVRVLFSVGHYAHLTHSIISQPSFAFLMHLPTSVY